MPNEIRPWFWTYTDVFGKRRRSTWRMSEQDAAHYKDAVNLEWSLEVRHPITGAGASHVMERHETPK